MNNLRNSGEPFFNPTPSGDEPVNDEEGSGGGKEIASDPITEATKEIVAHAEKYAAGAIDAVAYADQVLPLRETVARYSFVAGSAERWRLEPEARQHVVEQLMGGNIQTAERALLKVSQTEHQHVQHVDPKPVVSTAEQTAFVKSDRARMVWEKQCDAIVRYLEGDPPDKQIKRNEHEEIEREAVEALHHHVFIRRRGKRQGSQTRGEFLAIHILGVLSAEDSHTDN